MADFLGRLRRRLTPAPQPPDIAVGRRSRAMFAFGEANWVTVDQLTANTYLAALMLYLGFGDSDIGTIMSFGALVCVGQLLTLSMNRLFRGKRMVVTLTSAARVLLALLFFMPFLPWPKGVLPPLFVIVYFVARAVISFGGPAACEWSARLTPMRIRGRYYAAKDAAGVGVQAVVLLIAGMVLDRYRSTAPLNAFAILGFMILAMCVLGFIAYMLAEDRPDAAVAEDTRERMGPQIRRCLADKTFRIVLAVDCIWQITYYVACPYNASFSIKEMGLSFTFISAVGFVSNIVRIFIARKMGAWADRSTMGKVLRWAVLILGAHYLVWAAMRPEAAVPMYIVMSALATVAWSFINVGVFGIKLELLPEGDRQVQFAVTAAISGVVGFAMSYLSGRLLAVLQTVDLSVASVMFYPQTVLNLFGFLCTIGMAVFLHTVVEHAERTEKE